MSDDKSFDFFPKKHVFVIEHIVLDQIFSKNEVRIFLKAYRIILDANFCILCSFIISEHLKIKIPYDFRSQTEFSWENHYIHMINTQKMYEGFEGYQNGMVNLWEILISDVQKKPAVNRQPDFRRGNS